MVNVLISSPSSKIDPTYLPYIYGLLKTHCDQDDRLAASVNWLDPVYRRARPEVLLEDYDPESVDVLGLSCYAWNWYLQCGIARTLKEHNPDCLVVAGGPHCDYDDSDFFRDNPFLDIVVRQEGEEPFRRLLRQEVEGERHWDDIPGLYLPDEEGEPRLTDPAETLPEEEIMDVSPYEAQSDTFEAMIRETADKGESLATMLESNRGCPYRCSFCDWGSLTFSNIRKFSMERVRRDIDWLTSHPIGTVHITDANVGVFDRDVEIIEYLGRKKEENGYPHGFLYNATKTKLKNIPTIVKTLYDHDLIPRAEISLQHTNPDVLDAIERTNLSDEEVREMIDFNLEHDIPMHVSVILACPNDTYDSWKACLTDLMEMGIDGEYLIHNFEVLPNAPAAEPEYMEKWGIETTLVKDLQKHGMDRESYVPDLAKKHLITSTSTFDEDDWRRMWTYSFMVQAHQSMGFSRRLALYLRYCEGVSFLDFYEGLVDDLCRDPGSIYSDLHDRIMESERAFLNGDIPRFDRTELEAFPDYEYYLKWEEWLFVRLALQRDRAYDELLGFVLDRFDVDAHRTRDVVRYQRETLAAPDYDPSEGKTFDGEYDWPEYFDRPREALTVPPEEGARRFTVREQSLGGSREVPIRWQEQTGDERIKQWINIAVRDPMRRLDSLTFHQTVESTPRRSIFGRLTQRLRHRITGDEKTATPA